jgi:hypothetical protein
MGEEWDNPFWLPFEKYGELGKDEMHCLLYRIQYALLSFEIYQGGLIRAGSLALSKHVTHYDLQSGVPFCKPSLLPS